MASDPFEIQHTILTSLGAAISAQVRREYPDQRTDVVWAKEMSGDAACILKLANGEWWILKVERVVPHDE